MKYSFTVYQLDTVLYLITDKDLSAYQTTNASQVLLKPVFLYDPLQSLLCYLYRGSSLHGNPAFIAKVRVDFT